MLLKIYVLLITLSIIFDITERLVSSRKYGIPRIFRYNLNYRSFRLITLFEFTLFNYFIYFFTMLRSEETATF